MNDVLFDTIRRWKIVFLLPLLYSCTFKEQHLLNKIPEATTVKSIECYVDSSEKDDFQAIIHQSSFRKFDGPEIAYGHLRKNLWVKLVLENKTNKATEQFLSTDQVILEQLHFYKKTAGQWSISEAGWGKAIQNREVPSYLHAFQISLAPHASDTFYLKVRNEYQVMRLPLHLFDKPQFALHYNAYLFYDGLVTMALLTAILYCLYNLFNTSSKDRRTLRWYFLYALNFLLFYTVRISAPAYFKVDVDPMINYFVNISIFISTYTFVRFGTAFIQTEKQVKRTNFQYFLDALFAGALLVSLIPSWASNEFFHILKMSFFVLTILYLVWFLLVHFRQSFLAKIYFFMATPLILSGLVEGLTNVFGVFKIPNQFFEAFRISICIEMLYILFALIFREKYLSKKMQEKLLKNELLMLETEIKTQEAEQRRIAQDLHDDLGGTLATLKHLVLSKLGQKVSPQEEKQIVTLAEKAGDDLRRISHALMPPDFFKNGLVMAVEELCRLYQSEDLNIQFTPLGDLSRIPDKNTVHLYYIIAEALQNILKHSGANKAHIQLIVHDTELMLMIEDNGKGFETAQRYQGLGLRNMKIRTQNMGGTLNFDSNTAGTTLIIEIPNA